MQLFLSKKSWLKYLKYGGSSHESVVIAVACGIVVGVYWLVCLCVLVGVCGCRFCPCDTCVRV